jgi:GYF domain 2
MTQYFIHDGQNEKGPLDIEQLKLEPLQKDTPIWYDGLANWTTAGQVEELKGLFLTKPAPPPLIKATIATPPKMETRYSSYPVQNDLVPASKKSLKVPLLIAGAIAIIGIIGWLVYQNSQQSTTITDIQDTITTQNDAVQDREAERQRINGANTEKNKNYRNNWSDYISATNNSYSYREIGGIFGLEAIITNKTEYMLDEIEVQIGYVKENGDYFKSETVRVYNVPAHSTKSAGAPDSERGKSIVMAINSITSKKMHFCYQPGNWANNSDDPYFCK